MNLPRPPVDDSPSCSFTIKHRNKRDVLAEAEQLINVSRDHQPLSTETQYMRSIALSLLVIARNTNNMT